MHPRCVNQRCSVCVILWSTTKHPFGDGAHVDSGTHHRTSLQVSTRFSLPSSISFYTCVYRDYHINFLQFRLWIGVWIFALLIIFVTFNLSFLVKYITRFTEDCFASLVALIFIYDAIREILKLRKTYPINYHPTAVLDYTCSCVYNTSLTYQAWPNRTVIPTFLLRASTLNQTAQMACKAVGGLVKGSGCSTPVYQPNIFFFCLLLFLFTFFICMGLKEFRNSAFFPTKVSETTT